MGVIDKLNALDDKVGVPRGKTVKAWNGAARFWWLNLITGVCGVVVAVVGDVPWLAILALSGGFQAGFFYRERLLQVDRPALLSFFRPPR